MTRTRYRASMITLLLIVAVCARSAAQETPFTLPPPADATEALRLSFYTYDRGLPLNAKLKPLDETTENRRYSLTYDSVHDQRVTAILAIPKQFAAPFPAVLLMHGSGGHKDSDYIHAASNDLTKQGYATVSVDAQYRGDRKRADVTGELLNPDRFECATPGCRRSSIFGEPWTISRAGPTST